MANVAPSPNDFQAWEKNRPTKIATTASDVAPTETSANRGTASQIPKPIVEHRPKAVSAYREPMRSEIAPPG